ncbi:uncharacterized protein [Ptychodera flava]|uniref:uncharacterized protein n=1 Tax=Ptychodera flava TaxID=63121 RepID=UPI003969E0BD
MASDKDLATQSAKRTEYWEARVETCDGIRKVLNVPKAEELSKLEMAEFFGVLPSLNGKNVLDIGAGIGRYTVELAKKAKHVTALDLMEVYTLMNKESHGSMGNIDFLTADILEVEFPADSYDLMFSNGLLQYMEDEEIKRFALKALTWMTEGGHLFFREISENILSLKETVKDPSICRQPAEYLTIFDGIRLPVDGSDEIYKWSLVAMEQVQCVKTMFSKESDKYWLYQKVRMPSTN